MNRYDEEYSDSLEELKKLPKDVQEKIAREVGGMWYHTVHVVRENGKYDCGHCVCLKKQYAPDFKVWDFTRAVVSLDPELNKIILAEDEASKKWEKENPNFDWEAFGQ